MDERKSCSMRYMPLRSFKGRESAPTRGQRRAKKYFTVAARYALACKTSAMMLSFTELIPPGFQLSDRGNSRRSHTHGSNRNRIARHVIVNGRRNCTHC